MRTIMKRLQGSLAHGMTGTQQTGFILLMMISLALLPLVVWANNLPPVARVHISGYGSTIKPGSVMFYGYESYDPDGGYVINFSWYVDGVLKSNGPNSETFTHTFSLNEGEVSRTVSIKLIVKDDEQTTASIMKTYTITASGRTEYYLTDHLGSIRTTIDGTTGAVLGYDDYYPFGLAMPGRSSNTGTPNDLNKFTGHERDTEGNLNLDYMLARNYDPEIGRFYSVDPHSESYSSWSPYHYSANNPLRVTDPDGRDWFDKLMGAAIGTLTNVVPFTGALRDTYTPTDGADYNAALKVADDIAIVASTAMIDVGGGTAAAGGVIATAAVTAELATGGASTPISLPSAAVGGAMILEGAAMAGTGVSIMMNANGNRDAGYDRGKEHSTEKKALVEMAKNDKKTGITSKDMEAYKELNKQLPDPFPSNKVRGPESHNSGLPSSRQPHGHVGPVNHIPIKD